MEKAIIFNGGLQNWIFVAENKILVVAQSNTPPMDYLEKYTKALEEVAKLQALLRESEQKSHLLELENLQLKKQVNGSTPSSALNPPSEPIATPKKSLKKIQPPQKRADPDASLLVDQEEETNVENRSPEVSLATLQKIESIKQNPEATPWTMVMKKSHPGSMSYLNKYAKEALAEFIRQYLMEFYPSENDIPQVKIGTKMIDCIPEDLEDEFLSHLDDAIDNGLLDQKPKKRKTESPSTLKRRVSVVEESSPVKKTIPKKKRKSQTKESVSSETEETRSTEEEAMTEGAVKECDLPIPPNPELIKGINLNSDWEMIRFMK
jgi:hypothetical protein